MRFFSPSSKAVFGIMALAALMGCQSFSKQALEAAPRRSFAAEPVWIRSTGGEEHVGHPVPQLFVPIFFEDSVIAGNSYNNVSAYRKDSGALIWRLEVSKGTGPATLLEGTLYFGTLNGELLAVDAATGNLKWRYHTGAEAFSAPAVDETQVYFLASDGRLHAVNRSDGTATWSLYRPSQSTLTIRASGQPLLVGPHLGVGFPDGTFVKAEKSTGRILWERRFDTGQRFQDVDSTPVLVGSDVYVAGYETGLYAMDWNSGELKWTFHEGGPYAVQPLDGHLIYVSERSRTYKLEAATGNVLWHVHHHQDTSGPPTLLGDVLVQGLHSGQLLFRESSQGRELARLDYFSGLQGAAAADPAEGSVYLMSGFGNLYKIKTEWVTSR